MSGVLAISVHAGTIGAAARAAFEHRAEALQPPGTVLLATCHRVELYGERESLGTVAADAPDGAALHEDEAAIRHLVRLAVGLESAVMAEDQVLHQLRRAAHRARARGPLPPAIDRALDGALRAGRRARTWLPRRGGLAELALGRIAQHADWSRPVLVVGAGAMGRRASDALTVRGARLLVASRTPERARLLAHDSGGRAVGFDPGPLDLASVGGVVIALAGTWLLTEPSRRALADGSAWVIDLSAPGALEAELATRLGARLVTIDDLAQPTGSDLSAQLLERLDRLVEETLGEHRHWLERDRQRTLARALAERASEAQRAELDALWRRLPELAPEQRGEVERMAHHLTERLLRDPLEQLDEDRDGARALAARELFRL